MTCVHLLEYVVLGSLLNAGVGDMIESVVNIGEFSADDCDVLQKVLEIVVDSAPALFTLPEHQLQQNAQEEEEDKNNPQAVALPHQPQIGCSPQVMLHEFVPNWLKFRELILILGSGLQTVSDRWASGKGPLALHFTPEDISRLVVAMFEDTHRREGVLRELRHN